MERLSDVPRLGGQGPLGSCDDPDFPKVVGRTRFVTEYASELALIGTRIVGDQVKEDWSLFNSEREMDSIKGQVLEDK